LLAELAWLADVAAPVPLPVPAFWPELPEPVFAELLWPALAEPEPALAELPWPEPPPFELLGEPPFD